MTAEQPAPPAPPFARARPGPILWLAATGATLAAVEVSSRWDWLTGVIFVVPIWLVVGLIWLVRFFAVGSPRRFRFADRDLAAWLAIPIAMTVVFGLTRTTVPFDARLALSRPGMDATVAAVATGGPTGPQWIGLYPVEEIQPTPNGLRFRISDGLASIGFAWADDGLPADPGIDDPLHCCDQYRPLGDGWWLWTQSWD